MKIFPAYRVFIFATLVVAMFIPFSLTMAQTSGTTRTQVVQDDRVSLLVSKHILINQNLKGIPGYRIQIFFDSGNNSKTKAQGIYEEFISKYPGIGAYLSFKSPNYKVRIGDFRTRLDARRFLNEIIVIYPNAWITDDLINLPKVQP